LTDWDWQNDVQPVVTDEKYYSPPYSIRPPGEDKNVFGYCKAPDTLYIPSGRIEYLYNCNNDIWPAGCLYILFRVTQTPGDTTEPMVRYDVALSAGTIVVKRISAGEVKESWFNDLDADIFDQLNPLEWNWFRVTWWSEAGIGLLVRFETKIGDTWYRICDDFEGLTDLYTDYTYNRVGFRLRWATGLNPPYIDNIRIYKAV